MSSAVLRIAMTLVLVGCSAASGAAQGCLHGDSETPAEKARRTGALQAVRFINTAENMLRSKGGSYRALADLLLSPQLGDKTTLGWSPNMSLDKKEILPGFEARLTVGGADGYALIVVDRTDTCRFSYFTDERGTIYEGRVIR